MKIQFTTILLALNLSLSQQAFSTDNDSILLHENITELENQIENAATKHALWRDTSKVLTQAKVLLENNKHKEAKELIDLVKFQLTQSLEQAMQQSDISTLVPHYLTQ